jgi:flagellar protein FliS
MNASERKYLENRISMASKGDLFLMLFDGAIRFSESAKRFIAEGKIEEGGKQLLRAQDVVKELIFCLRREDMPAAVYDNLAGLYRFVHDRLVRANVKSDTGLIVEAVKILTHLRETWALALEAERAPQQPTAVGASPSSLELEG